MIMIDYDDDRPVDRHAVGTRVSACALDMCVHTCAFDICVLTYVRRMPGACHGTIGELSSRRLERVLARGQEHLGARACRGRVRATVKPHATGRGLSRAWCRRGMSPRSVPPEPAQTCALDMCCVEMCRDARAGMHARASDVRVVMRTAV